MQITGNRGRAQASHIVMGTWLKGQGQLGLELKPQPSRQIHMQENCKEGGGQMLDTCADVQPQRREQRTSHVALSCAGE